MNRKTRRAEKKGGKAIKSGSAVESGLANPPGQNEGKLLQVAVTFHQAGKLSEAEAGYRDILKDNPNQPDALHLLGVIAHQVGNHEVAVDLISQSLVQRANNAEAHNNLGNALSSLGRLDDSIASYRKAVASKPRYVDGLNNLGNMLKDAGQLTDAMESYQAVLVIDPENLNAHFSLGNIFLAQKRFDEAKKEFKKTLALDSSIPVAANNLGGILQSQGELAEAKTYFHQAITLSPDYAEAWNNYGNCLMQENNLQEAETATRKAIELKPDFADAYNNLGVVLRMLGRPDEAKAAHEDALRLQPDSVKAKFNESILDLLRGNFRNGWAGYELRWKADEDHEFSGSYLDISVPLWDGSSLEGKRILIWGEQAVGDQIMFASMVPDLVAARAKVRVACEPRLIPLFQRSFPGIEVSEKATEDGIDCHLPMGSLALHLRPDGASFPDRPAYLRADPDRTREIRERYSSLFPAWRLIGISWRSGNKSQGRARSILLDDWQGILGTEGCAFINLQYGDVTQEIKALHDRTGLVVHHDDAIDPLKDMDAFASQIAALDQVISIDNSTVHAAGALGVPVWTLLSLAPEWRWFLDRESSLWYPAMRLFRQTKLGKWDDVIGAAMRALADEREE